MTLASVEPIHSQPGNRLDLRDHKVASGGFTEAAAALVLSNGFVPASRSFKKKLPARVQY
jgi:hypothetical protein